MAHYTFRQMLRYKFDNFMAKGGRSIFTGLVLIFLIALFILACLRGAIVFVSPKDAAERGEQSIPNHIFQVFNHLSDPGTMAYDIDSSPWLKMTSIIGAMVGVVIFSALIAFITTAMDQKISELKKGHSKVVEDEHSLILGWNERVVEILRELLLANESEDDPCAVILSKLDKEEMDDYLNVHLHDRMNTRIVTRSGAESSLVNLDIVSVDTCRSVIVLASCNPGASDEVKAASDNIVIKTILAVIASLEDEADVPIVAEIFHERNRQVVEDIAPNIVTVDTNDILSKILVQTSRSVGLSVVYGEILSFDGCEMYFYDANWGKINFGELAYYFPDGVPMGIKRRSGELLINPSVDLDMRDGDEILILAEDDSTIDYQKRAKVAEPKELSLAGGRQQLSIEHELIIGWTPKVATIISEYADYVLEGSTIDVMLRVTGEDGAETVDPDDVRTEVAALNEELSTVTVSLIEEDPLSTEGLLAIEPFKYDNIIILSQGAEGDDERTDSETIVILLLLRNIFKQFPDESANTKLITEVLDSENQELVARTGVNDFIISNRFISMLLAQVSENADIKRVYDDLFSEDGSEIYLKPATLYFSDFPAKVTYADMIRIAQAREEVCLGVKLKESERDMEQNFGVKLIPEKDVEYTLNEEDSLVVLAEDET